MNLSSQKDFTNLVEPNNAVRRKSASTYFNYSSQCASTLLDSFSYSELPEALTLLRDQPVVSGSSKHNHCTHTVVVKSRAVAVQPERSTLSQSPRLPKNSPRKTARACAIERLASTVRADRSIAFV